MSALAVLTHTPNAIADGIRTSEVKLYPVLGDNMEPTLRKGQHMVMGRACAAYDGEAMYVFKGGVVYQADRCCNERGQIRVSSHNKAYTRGHRGDVVSPEWFSENVIAKVIADVRVWDHEEQTALWGRAAEALSAN